ncbi:FkbM family methyltransferase [Xanthocytophaga agilis]|uniref:FkbM family methyltransferase n=1 Tax=Xanthocytophaga agilis TaxID=3048010 RepID=A0AAE3R680_9BACT|nr:FkbM family methyltransferase [Xanthocytophaga agilis]MDJ1502180.1 FkbM family methyltransferase [Xanthocytophaga agilis]
MLAPIVLFVYNRPWHTSQTLEALSKNDLADQSVLYIYADGPKKDASPEALEKIKETRNVIREQQWCKEIHIIEADINKGLAESIIQGVTDVVNRFGKVIVLEDDIVTSKGFLQYMNDALNLYENTEEVMHVSGFMFPIQTDGLSETFFYNANSCWGWATWKRAWKSFNSDARSLLIQLSDKGPIDYFTFNAGQGNAFYQQLIQNVNGQIRTWAVKWHTSIFLNNGLCLHPKISLIRNIGHDGSGENCDISSQYKDMIIADSITVNNISVQANDAIAERVAEYQYLLQFPQPQIKPQPKISVKRKLYRKVKSFLHKPPQSVTPPVKKVHINKEVMTEEERLRILPRYIPTTTDFQGSKFKLADAPTFLGGRSEIFEKGIYEFKASSNQPFIIDCGANIGLSVTYFKKLYPDAYIIAFEPDNIICSILQQNINSFGFNTIQVYQEAIWTENGFIEFQVEGGFSGRIPKPGDETRLVKVKSRRLKDLLIDKKVDFLKVDIEGAEYEVLMDCKDVLQNVENIFIEYHSHITESQKLDKILSILSENGFRYHIHEAYTRPRPYVQRELMLGMDLQLDIFGYRI